VNSKPIEVPFSCQEVDYFMFGKAFLNLDAVLNDQSVDSTVHKTFGDGHIDHAVLLDGDVPFDVEDNYKREIRELGAPSMIALFNFDSQPYSHSM
jgi:hypothetical protein